MSKQSREVQPDSAESQQQVVTAPEPETAPAPEKRYVLKSVPIDKFSVKRIRVELTPSVCDLCGFDVIITNGLPSWDNLNSDQQLRVESAIKEHKQIYHSPAEGLVISESEMPKSWLGQHSF